MFPPKERSSCRSSAASCTFTGAANRIRAAANTCLHFGGPLECKDGKFVCGWHGAEFDAGSGKRLAGPAPAASQLMFISTRQEDDTLYYVWGE